MAAHRATGGDNPEISCDAARIRPESPSARRSATLVQQAVELPGQRLDHIAQHGAAAGLNDDLRRHAGHELRVAEPAHLLRGEVHRTVWNEVFVRSSRVGSAETSD